jgi:ubiquinone/menaquinone biosynthesis C-methylase UbiE
MKHLKNWDNKTWLSSSRYLASLIKFLNHKIRFNNQTTILDIGCGRGKLIGTLSNKYHLKNLPIGIDIVKHKIRDKKIKFINTSAVNYLKKTKLKFDLILFKQSIHFFKLSEIKTLILNAQRILNKDGKIIILSLDTKRNDWPKFKSFKLKVE